MIIFSTALTAVFLRDDVDPAEAALSITYALSMAGRCKEGWVKGATWTHL